MSLLTKILQTGCKQVLRPKRNRISDVGFASKLFHQLPKLSGKAALEALSNTAATAQDKEAKEMVADSKESRALLPAAQHPRHQRVKSLKEMPGPKFFSNLLEFFWKDGFARIHEIQVCF